MRSAHASACFVRVGPRRFGSILGSILESFWEPSSPLYSFLVALVANSPPPKGGFLSVRFVVDFRVRPGWGGAGMAPRRNPGETPGDPPEKTPPPAPHHAG